MSSRHFECENEVAPLLLIKDLHVKMVNDAYYMQILW